MSYNTVTVTTTATKIVDTTEQRRSLIISNASSVTVYLGFDADVTTANGLPLVPEGTFQNDNSGGRMWLGPYYAIVETGTADVRYLEYKDGK